MLRPLRQHRWTHIHNAMVSPPLPQPDLGLPQWLSQARIALGQEGRHRLHRALHLHLPEPTYVRVCVCV
jgi:hypothetical protein